MSVPRSITITGDNDSAELPLGRELLIPGATVTGTNGNVSVQVSASTASPVLTLNDPSIASAVINVNNNQLGEFSTLLPLELDADLTNNWSNDQNVAPFTGIYYADVVVKLQAVSGTLGPLYIYAEFADPGTPINVQAFSTLQFYSASELEPGTFRVSGTILAFEGQEFRVVLRTDIEPIATTDMDLTIDFTAGQPLTRPITKASVIFMTPG